MTRKYIVLYTTTQECTTKKEEIVDVIPPPSSLCAPGTTWGRVQEVQKGRSMVMAGKGQSGLIICQTQLPHTNQKNVLVSDNHKP